MKLIILIGFLNLSTSAGNSAKTVNKSTHDFRQLKIIKNNSHLSKIPLQKIAKKSNTTVIDSSFFEDSIEEIIGDMFRKKNIVDVENEISRISDDSKMTSGQKRYWKGYLLYNESLFYKSYLKDDNKASKAIDLAIKTLEANLKTSDDYALMAACTSFSIQFANVTQLSGLSAKTLEYATRALEVNSKNIRAYYVLASNNFYTPRMFGGGTEVEEYAIKGLACPNSLDNAFYSPYWGKPHIYSILIQYLKSEKRKDDVARYRALAKKEFPTQF